MNNTKSVIDRVMNIVKKNMLVSATVVFAVVLCLVAVILVRVTEAKEEREARLAYEALSDEEKALYEQDFTVVKDAYEDLNTAISEYMTALADNDVEYIRKVSPTASENKLDNIDVRSELIESYSDITCYTQNGRSENSYYVYVTYLMKLNNFEEYIPGIIGMYVVKHDDGSFIIFRKDDMPETVKENFYVAYMRQDVQDIYNQVSLAYNETLESNEELKDYLDNKYSVEVKTDMAELITEKAEEAKALEEENSEPEVPKVEIVKAITSVNVRTSDSETAERLGTIGEGTELTRLENKLNGWSKVQYEGKEAYIKSEYLEVIGVKDADGSVTEVAENDDNDTPDTTATTTDTKYVTATDNVNIRAEADIDSDRVGFVYNGDKLELVEKLSNGWTKIKYNGKDAYVKSDYVK